MTKLQTYLMYSAAVAQLEADLAAGRVPPIAGAKGLARLKAQEAAAFAALLD